MEGAWEVPGAGGDHLDPAPGIKKRATPVAKVKVTAEVCNYQRIKTRQSPPQIQTKKPNFIVLTGEGALGLESKYAP
jgi:hypothetical protein